MKTEHTEGPWVVDGPETSDRTDDAYHVIEAGKGFYGGIQGNGFSISGCMSLADARLIAAAPDMFDALQDALASLEISGQSDYVTGRVRAAIAKARGEV